MNIVLVSPKSDTSIINTVPGGIGVWTKHYLDYFADSSEHKVELVNTVLGKRRLKTYGRISLIEEVKRTVRIIRSLRKALKAKPDVVHLNTNCGKMGLFRDLYCAKIVKKHKVKLLVNYRCNIQDQVKTKVSIMLFQELAQIADCNLALSNASKNYLINNGLANNAFVIANPYWDSAISPSEVTIRDEVHEILYVGQITEAKGCKEINEVAVAFPQKHFALVGARCPDMEKYQFASNVSTPGPQGKTELARYRSLADLFIFPSHTEGFPNAVLEVMASGLPVLATPVGAIPEMIEKEGGILVKVGDVEELINGINQMSVIKTRQKMAYFNINKVNSSYSYKKVMPELINYYHLLSDKDEK